LNHFSYALAPFAAWFIAGIIKLFVTSFKARRVAFDLIGYGGFPSTHSAIVSCIPALIALKDGVNNPAFGIATTVAFIVILDAHSLRRQIGFHATEINQLIASHQATEKFNTLRERMGHTIVEIIAGILVGIVVAFGLVALENML
jgi:uncharacterized protein